jgi:FKBP-type peptidyl-prolyl cis-trans isomerase FklB
MRFLSTLILAAFTLSLHAEPVKLDTERDRISYSVGQQIGANFKRQAIDLEPELIKRGIQDALAGAAPQLTEEAMEQARTELRRQIVANQQAQARKAVAGKRAAGSAFLAENGKKAGVIVLPSGLQYQVITEGSGAKPGPRDKVTVHYRGTLIDGSEFDSSYRRKEPASFPLNGVIAGWTEGLQLMRLGAKYQFFIPPELAYREQGRLANETLVFEVELLAVEPAAGASN